MNGLMTPFIIAAVIVFVILLACFWFSIKGRKPYVGPRVATQAGVIVRPMNTGTHVAPLGTTIAVVPMGADGAASGNEYVFVPRSVLEQQGVQAVQMPQAVFDPVFHQNQMESIRESSGAFMSSAPTPMMAPAAPQSDYVSTEQEQQTRVHSSTPPATVSHAATSQ